MNERLKIFGIIALFGFLAGVMVQLAADYLFPWLAVVLPALMQVRFVVAGIAGAALTLVLVSVWAYATKRDRP
jgi:cation transporter-like permease